MSRLAFWGKSEVYVLCIDTATSRVGVAIGSEAGVLGEVGLAQGQRHGEHLAPAIKYLTSTLGISLSQIAVIGLDVGPGLFTGLRVGVTTAKVMAQALRIPVVPIPSLDLLAYPMRHSGRPIVAALDARRKEVFSAHYLPVPGGIQRVGEYEVLSPDRLADELASSGQEALLVGDGALAYSERFSTLERTEIAGPSFAHPCSAALVELTVARARREEFIQSSEVRPMYLRRPDAEINWQHV